MTKGAQLLNSLLTFLIPLSIHWLYDFRRSIFQTLLPRSLLWICEVCGPCTAEQLHSILGSSTVFAETGFLTLLEVPHRLGDKGRTHYTVIVVLEFYYGPEVGSHRALAYVLPTLRVIPRAIQSP